MNQLPSFVGSALQRWSAPTPAIAPAKPPNPLSYPKSTQAFSSKLFKKPTSEYRGCPLWSWDTKLSKDKLLRQIDNYEAMGLGGFTIHVRIGLDTEYMGTEFLDRVRDCAEYAKSKGMLCCLYDDDRWPSGAAGGRVIKEYPQHKGKHILFTPHLYGTVPLGGDRTPTSGRACRSEDGFILATYDVELDENGCLLSSRLLKDGETGTNVWYAYLETNPDSPWFNDQTYVDTLSPEAISKFIEITHERYKAKIGDLFGTVVPSIFTDEPQFATKTQLSSPKGMDDIFLPWTTDLPETFKKEYDADLVAGLPEIVWNLPEGKPSLTRYRWHDHLCERFVGAFMDQIGNWCKKNGIVLNGHMMEEPTLYSQTTAIGEAMRCYRNQEMPGMDLLCDWVEYNTAKQVTSVARQNGVRGTMTEIYGVTHWYFTFEGHKGCGDWQAALGITMRVHHLTWVSMRGEAKRDYPACIGYQSPWYKEYGFVEDHFARVAVAMTRGKAVTRVGVIHPIESYWLAFGPSGSGDELGIRDQAFADLTTWLLHGSFDFDFIAESLLPDQVEKKIGKKLKVGHCEYDVIIVPNLRTIRSSTLEVLRAFGKAGGQIIIAGSAHEWIDAQFPKSKIVVSEVKHVFWSKQTILDALEEYREIRITTSDGNLTERLLHQIRQEGDERYVFICNEDRSSPVETTVQLKGKWNVEVLDTLSGEKYPLKANITKGWTVFPYKFEGCASLLVHLTPSSTSLSNLLLENSFSAEVATASLALSSVKLSEPNVLLLDYATYKITGDTEWSGRIEILQIDNIIRSRLALPQKGEAWKQPWAVPASDRKAITTLTLNFQFESSFDVSIPTKLAIEDYQDIDIVLNGNKIESIRSGWWVDEDISTVDIRGGIIKAGQNLFTLTFPFGLLTNVERIYLLGNFGVELQNNRHDPVLQPLDLSTIGWGDITTQGLPFYVGNTIYECDIDVGSPKLGGNKNEKSLILRIPNFSAPVITVHDITSCSEISDNNKLGVIALQPHTLRIPLSSLSTNTAEPTKYKLSITSYGNRYNSYGHLHLPEGVTIICGPSLFRTGGWGPGWWTENYEVRAMGILEIPSLVLEEVDGVEDVKNLDSWGAMDSGEWVVL